MLDIRTDLAVEENERITERKQSIRGVTVEEDLSQDGGIRVTTVRIDTENAARAMGKPRGTYITLESSQMSEESACEEDVCDITGKLAEILHSQLEKKKAHSILVAGLGNRDVTPDALGPQVVDRLCITRHLLHQYGRFAFGKTSVAAVSAIAPGVMAQTGMETGEILQGIVRQVRPDCLIVIDALAARSMKRLCRTIQITDTGIHPGSGVGNHRHAITEESVGVPVLAIGIPTVVDAATIVRDALDTFLCGEQTDMAAASPKLHEMFVTSKDIDAQIRQMSTVLSEGINLVINHI